MKQQYPLECEIHTHVLCIQQATLSYKFKFLVFSACAIFKLFAFYGK